MPHQHFLAVTGLLVGLASFSALAQSAHAPADLCAAAVPAAEPTTRVFPAPEHVLQEGVDYRAIFCTSAGPIYVDLFETVTPETVNNFIFLASNGYYNNTNLSGRAEGLQLAGGDPTGTGTGGPGYQFSSEIAGFLMFDRPGILAMWTSEWDINGSQFFITTSEIPLFDYDFSIFGEVLFGQAYAKTMAYHDSVTPGDVLNTVLIISDPSEVEVDVPPLESATTAELRAALDRENRALSASMGQVDSDVTGVFDLDATIEQLSDSVQASARTMFEGGGFEMRVRSSIDSCNSNPPGLGKLGYTLDAYADAGSAAAAIASGVYDAALNGEGFTARNVEGWSQPLYTRSTTSCDQPMIEGATIYQRGRYVVEVRASVIDEQPLELDGWITGFVARRYERAFADVLRRELR